MAERRIEWVGGNWFVTPYGWVDHHLPDLNRAELAVLWALARHADRQTGEAHPLVKTIQRLTGLNMRTVQRALHGRTSGDDEGRSGLIGRGLVEIVDPGGGRERTPTYRLKNPGHVAGVNGAVPDPQDDQKPRPYGR